MRLERAITRKLQIFRHVRCRKLAVPLIQSHGSRLCLVDSSECNHLPVWMPGYHRRIAAHNADLAGDF